MGQRERADPEQWLQPDLSSPRLTWFQDIFLAASLILWGKEMSKEQMVRRHFWTNSVHECVSEPKAPDMAMRWGPLFTPRKKENAPASGKEESHCHMKAAVLCL